jgi:predicted PurR-regulated permease PerM
MIKTNRQVRALLLLSSLIFIIWSLGSSRGIFIISFLLAYFLRPLMAKLEVKGLSRSTASLLILLVTIGPLLAAIVLIVPMILSEFKLFALALPEKANLAFLQIENMARQYNIDLPVNSENLNAWLIEKSKNISVDMFSSITGFVASSALSVTGAIVSFLSLILAPVVFLYVLSDFEEIKTNIHSLVPMSMRPSLRALARSAEQIFSSYFRGQLMASFLLAMFYGLGLWLSGISYGFVIGVLTGTLSFIPYVGYSLGCLAAAIVILATSPGLGIIAAVIVVMLLGQFLESFVIVPKLVGNQVGLSALETLLALIACGNLFGFIGLLLALPLGALFKETLKELK